jgi:hypothetical protein
VLARRPRRDDAVGGRLPARPVRLSLEAGGERTIEIWRHSLEEDSELGACMRST